VTQPSSHSGGDTRRCDLACDVILRRAIQTVVTAPGREATSHRGGSAAEATGGTGYTGTGTGHGDRDGRPRRYKDDDHDDTGAHLAAPPRGIGQPAAD
jgi:hypothetical protein